MSDEKSMSKATAVMNHYNSKCSTITIIVVAALLMTLLHIFVPFMGGAFFAIISILLLIAAAAYTGLAGVQLFRDIKGQLSEADKTIRKGLERNAALNCILAAVLTSVMVVVLFRTLE